MNNKSLVYKLFVLILILLYLAGCATVPEIPVQGNREEPVEIAAQVVENPEHDYFIPDFLTYPHLEAIYEVHRIDELSTRVKEAFVDRYVRTMKVKYVPAGGGTFCTLYYYDYFMENGYGDVLEEMRSAPGKTMVEKAINYEAATGRIQVLYSGFEAQTQANRGKVVGVIGEYYYDKAETRFTRHYSVVQPSKTAYDEEGNLVPYPVTGLITKRTDVNGRHGTGAFLAQVGVANGLIDFRWAYNGKLDGIIQKDRNGNIRGGIIFVVFPDDTVLTAGNF